MAKPAAEGKRAQSQRDGLPDPLLPDQDGRVDHIAEWARRLHRVPPRGLRVELADSMGLTRFRPTVVDWLPKYEYGSATSPGFGPE